jgi:hypothetical protein
MGVIVALLHCLIVSLTQPSTAQYSAAICPTAIQQLNNIAMQQLTNAAI